MRIVKFRMGALPKVTQLLKEAMWLHTSSSRLNRPLSLPHPTQGTSQGSHGSRTSLSEFTTELEPVQQTVNTEVPRYNLPSPVLTSLLAGSPFPLYLALPTLGSSAYTTWRAQVGSWAQLSQVSP